MQNDHKSGILIITFGLRNNIKNMDVHNVSICPYNHFFGWGVAWHMMIAVGKQSQNKVLQYQYKIKI